MKRDISAALFLSIFCLFFIDHAHAQSCAPAPAGIVAWWQGEGNALDSRSGNNGTLNGGTTFGTGEVGQAFSFDGVDDSILVSDSPSLHTVTTAATFEAWINPQIPNDNQAYLFARRRPGFFESFSVVIQPGGELNLILGTTGEGTVAFTTGAGQIQFDGQWKHIALTVNTATGASKAYINGAEVAMTQFIGTTFSGQLRNDIDQLHIAKRGEDQFFYKGLLDEPTYYAAELSQAQIQAIVNAGLEGKCILPPNLVGWWAGDGNVDDISGSGLNGAFVGPSSFSIGKVGQDLSFDGGQTVQVADSNTLDFTNAFTIEMWVEPTGPASPFGQSFFIGKGDFNGANTQAYGIAFTANNKVGNRVGNGLTFDQVTSNAQLPLNAFTHVATTYDGGTLKVYINGVLDNSQATTIGTVMNSTRPLVIGGAEFTGGTINVRAAIDETTVYNRALTAAEIASIFNAGAAGKLKRVTTPTGSNVSVVAKSDSTVTFPSVTTSGSIQQIPLDPAQLPSLPAGTAGTGLAYDISTNAGFTGTPTICFHVPAVTDNVSFSKLRILHFETSSWRDRTDLSSINFSTRTICTTGVPSLSPFAIVSSPLTAASVSISGHVLTLDGKGITNAIVSLTDASGNTHSVMTGRRGNYRFDEIEAGQTVIVSVSARRFVFEDPTRVIQLVDEVTGEDFVGSTHTRSAEIRRKAIH